MKFQTRKANECIGCKSHAEGTCHMVTVALFNICPCSKCLVKGICTDGCEPYNNFWAIQHEENKKGSLKNEVSNS